MKTYKIIISREMVEQLAEHFKTHLGDAIDLDAVVVADDENDRVCLADRNYKLHPKGAITNDI